MHRYVRAGIAASLLVLCVAATTPWLTLDGDAIPAVSEVGESDPLASDTDGDGLPDGVEAAGATDPASADTDGDGFGDRREYGRGDPVVADTDHDGLDDGREADLGTNLSAVDTDGDRLPDAAEVRATDALPNASPTRMDVFVDVPGLSDCPAGRPNGIARTKRAFAEAPVENYDGTTGITSTY